MRHGVLALASLGMLGLAGCPQPPLNLEPTTLPNGVEDRAYDAGLTADTTRALVWEISDGALPAGLSLDSASGDLSGTPTQPGTFDFTVSSRESAFAPRVGSQSYELVIIPKLTVGSALAPARVNQLYGQALNIAGGVPPYQVTVLGLPAGLSFDAATATIAGTPLLPSTGVPLQITVHDSGTPQQSAAALVQLVIKPLPVSISTANLPAGQLNHAYSAQVAAVNGQAPYSWGFLTSAPGTLPPGLSLNTATGAITGTPTLAGTSTFTLKVTDSDSPPNTDNRQYSITINP